MGKIKSYEEEMAKIEKKCRKDYERSLKHMTKEKKEKEMQEYDEMVKREYDAFERYKAFTKSLAEERRKETLMVEKMTKEERMVYIAKKAGVPAEDIEKFGKVKTISLKEE